MRYVIPIVLLACGLAMRFGGEREIPDLPAFSAAEIVALNREAEARTAARAQAAAGGGGGGDGGAGRPWRCRPNRGHYDPLDGPAGGNSSSSIAATLGQWPSS
jgi:hypothetical protein